MLHDLGISPWAIERNKKESGTRRGCSRWMAGFMVSFKPLVMLVCVVLGESLSVCIYSERKKGAGVVEVGLFPAF